MGGLEVGGRSDVGPAGEAGAVGEDHAGEDHRAEVGPGAGGDGGLVVGVRDVLLLGADAAVAHAEADAEALVQEDVGVIELVVGAPLAADVVVPAMGLAKVGGVRRVEAGAELPVDAAAFAVESAAGAHVDGAGGRIGVHVGAEGAADLDGFDGVDGHLLEADRARLAAGGTVERAAVGDEGIGAGDGGAVHGDTDVLLVEAADARATADAIDVFDFDAGEEFQKLTDVALGDIAESIRGDGGGDVHVAALLHDGLGVALALVGNDEGLELERFIFAGGTAGLGADNFEITSRDGARGHDHRRGRQLVARKGDLQRGGADGHVGELVDATVFGECDLLRALEADFGVPHVFTGRRIEDTARDGAGSGLGEERRRRCGQKKTEADGRSQRDATEGKHEAGEGTVV